jgi:hypothetical protein
MRCEARSFEVNPSGAARLEIHLLWIAALCVRLVPRQLFTIKSQLNLTFNYSALSGSDLQQIHSHGVILKFHFVVRVVTSSVV